MATRRDLVRGVGATALAGGLAGSGPGFWAGAAQADHPALSEDGLYQEPWFLQSFLELADDLDQAARNGKRFAVMWELKGCPYCRETHLVNFARQDIADFVRSNFEIGRASCRERV